MIPTTFALFERIEVGGVAPVGAVSGQFGKIAVLLQIRQCPLDGAAGEIHVFRYRLDPRPAASRTIRPILEVQDVYKRQVLSQRMSPDPLDSMMSCVLV